MQDSLGDRMKGYERVTDFVLTRRMPLIVRVDGRCFHTWTRGAEKPFDPVIVGAMVSATAELAKDMQGCKLAYVQSDEASFLLTDYDTLEAQPWFGNALQKIVSVAASLFTAVFNWREFPHAETPAQFDARAFSLPQEEIANYFLWRARDCRRNSINAMAQAHFSSKQLDGVSTDERLEMLGDAGQSWADLDPVYRCGMFLTPGGLRIGNCEANYASVSGVVDVAMANITDAEAA